MYREAGGEVARKGGLCPKVGGGLAPDFDFRFERIEATAW